MGAEEDDGKGGCAGGERRRMRGRRCPIREVRDRIVHGADVDTAHAPDARAEVQPVRRVLRCGRSDVREEDER